ncbi:MAG: hypothetical protein ACOY45_01480 [Pseudomonadota bacterium]
MLVQDAGRPIQFVEMTQPVVERVRREISCEFGDILITREGADLFIVVRPSKGASEVPVADVRSTDVVETQFIALCDGINREFLLSSVSGSGPMQWMRVSLDGRVRRSGRK